MALFFTSDHHFGHFNIIKYCDRPYANVDEMDTALIKNWNSVVQDGDDVYHLGDIFFGTKKSYAQHTILPQLKGNIHLIYGNHDEVARAINTRFVWKKDYFELKPKDPTYPKIILSHYAFKVWNGAHKGAWQLYGHSHGTLPDDPNSLSFDVGVDCHDFKPIGIERVAELMSVKRFIPQDHHGSPESEERERIARAKFGKS